MTTTKLEEEARTLADSYREADPAIQQILWFPDDKEVRLLLVSSDIVATLDETEVHPFYFRPAEMEGLSFASGIAYVSPSEVEKLRLPEGWGTWPDGVSL